MPVALQFYTTEDWRLRLTAKDAQGNPYDLTGMDLRMQLRVLPNYREIADLTTANGGITLESSNVALVESLAKVRGYLPGASSTVTGDLMGYPRTGEANQSVFLGRVTFLATPGYTHD